MTDEPTHAAAGDLSSAAEKVADAPVKNGKGFISNGLNIFRHTEESIAHQATVATEANKGAETLEKINNLKVGGLRWGRIALVGLPIAAVTAMFIAGTGNKGPGKYADQESTRQQSQTGASVA